MSIQGTTDPWVGNELRILARNGIPFVLHALRRSETNYFRSIEIKSIGANTRYIYPLPLARTTIDLLAAPFRFRGRFFGALWNALTGPRESVRNRVVGIWHLVVACHWAAGLRGQDVSHIHSQWIHSAGTVAMYGAWLTGTSFSFTGHAADLFRDRCALVDKIRRAEFIICISEFHRQFYLDNGARPEQMHIAYCGIDTSHFKPNRRTRPEGAPFNILSSGRLVEKKGFAVLIDACAILRDRGVDFHCTIGGSGPDEAALRERIAAAGLAELVTLTGKAQMQEDIPTFLGSGDVYCLACVWASDNDVDGLPQVLMEAMACGLPAVSTRLVGIPDLVRDGETGLLVEPHDATGLADALEKLMRDPDLAERLAEAGRKHVVQKFDFQTCIDGLLDLYREKLEARR
ncbi:glycosyltransferase family 4 protein [Palleronia sp. KMU-117]|uniref:glycosyltransferase family 4 protein n=1 Tax=Palleronia sp. KMU-117 TaxID=3434108 RepID=UPI003D706158